MDIITHWQGIDPGLRGASVAMGNFDGVHRGHQAVIDHARRADAPLGIVTFDPHPREYFAPHAPPFRLMNTPTRRNRLRRLGVERLYELPFGAPLASLSPEAFARDVLAAGLGIAHVVVGADFCFGKGRAGTAAMLSDFGSALGFGVTVVPLIGGEAGAISSTAIRAALSDGRVQDAADMLGHRHRVDGEVQHGAKRGRTLGYPTANLSLAGLHLPRFGVYAVKVDVIDGPHRGCHEGVASLGVRPMFGKNTPNLEVHLFDFSGDLYGAQLSVAMVELLRGEEKFDTLDALIAQMDADSARARAVLAGA
ncbi:bifunctional riboflavin kinase/FAD synthetase [Pararhodobacter sp. SW119]|uniref:bifunctional riboflavin kinase/FAD synthetase n=1 Tax=Pararhodobacter sp. SW119 TaxID=2780075 RepID=UPI001AE079EF|nr:bifunctional riboflavin kinase/FAD synthetase [Pararhodobacter sp. SW119]